MDGPRHLVILLVGDRRLALRLDCVDRVIRAVEISPIPEASREVAGVINIHGRIVPVVSLRPRLGMAARPLSPTDQFVIARVGAGSREVALWVDRAEMTAVPGDALTAGEQVVPGAALVLEIARWEGHVVPVVDLDVLMAALGDVVLTDPVESRDAEVTVGGVT